MRGAGLWVAVMLASSGCAAHKDWKQGQDYEARGADWKAAQSYEAALRQNPHYEKAITSLSNIGQQAVDQEIGKAQKAEADKAFDEALQDYTSVQDFLNFVHGTPADREFGAKINLKKKIAEVSESGAMEAYAQGEAALAADRWQDAITAYQKAQGFLAGFRDTEAKIAAAHYGWALQDQKNGSWRDAAAQFTAAVPNGPADATARATGIYAALGRAFLNSGACRQAVRDLRTAMKSSRDASLAKDEQNAETCAAVPVAVLPFDNPTGVDSLGGLSVQDSLTDAVSEHVRAGGSEFLKLIDVISLDSLLRAQGLDRRRAQVGAHATLPVRYLVVGKLSQVSMGRPHPVTTKATENGSQPGPCDPPVQGTTCPVPVPLSYIEHDVAVSLHLDGQARVVDTHTGEIVATIPLSVDAGDTIRFADGLALPNGAAPDRSVVTVPGPLDDLLRARNQLLPDADVAKAAIGPLATQVSAAVLKAVDADPPVSDPHNLVVAPLP